MQNNCFLIVSADCERGCENGGSCHSDGGVPRCSCVEGFKGDRCQIGNLLFTWRIIFLY